MTTRVVLLALGMAVAAGCSSKGSHGNALDAMNVINSDATSEVMTVDATDTGHALATDVADAATDEAIDATANDLVDAPPADADAIMAAEVDALDGRQDAGPDLSTICGMGLELSDACSFFCSAVDMNCTDANRQFADFDSCVELCMTPTWSCGSPGDQTVNTIFCRFGHADAAATAADVAAQCQNAGSASTDCR